MDVLLRVFGIYVFLVAVVLTTKKTVSAVNVLSRNQINLVDGEASADVTTEPVGASSSVEECMNTFVVYDNHYLMGVKENFLSHNKTSLQKCKEMCCSDHSFSCKSFSYMPLMSMCMIMNVTKNDDESFELKETASMVHYHRVFPEDVTPTTAGIITSNESRSDADSSEFQYTTATTNIPTPGSNLSSPESFSRPQTKATPKNSADRRSTSTIATPQGSMDTPDASHSPVSHEATESTSDSATTEPHSFSVSMASSTGYARTSPGTGATNVKSLPNVFIHNTNSFVSTTESIAILPDATTSGTTTTTILGEVTTHDNNQLGITEKRQATTKVQETCSKNCQNGGKCEWKIINTEGNTKYESAKCTCVKGFSGNRCEKKELKTGGVPSYVIAGAVLGSIIILLFLTVLIIFILYRSRTGKYRVREQRERWNNTMKARRAQSFNSLSHRSPVGSELSVPGSVNSTATRSTATSI